MTIDTPPAIGQRIREARNNAGLSQQDLADLSGVSQQTIAKIESGQTENSRHLLKIARSLNLSPDNLEPIGEAAPREALIVSPGALPPQFKYRHDNRGVDPSLVNLYPLYARPEFQLWMDDYNMGVLRRIEPLWDSRGAYGLYVAEDLSAPAIGAGDIVLANPDLPPLPGTDCVFIRKTRENGAKPWIVEIRRLVSADPENWLVEQFNPPKTYKLKRQEFTEAHRVVAIYRRP